MASSPRWSHWDAALWAHDCPRGCWCTSQMPPVGGCRPPACDCGCSGLMAPLHWVGSLCRGGGKTSHPRGSPQRLSPGCEDTKSSTPSPLASQWNQLCGAVHTPGLPVGGPQGRLSPPPSLPHLLPHTPLLAVLPGRSRTSKSLPQAPLLGTPT